MSFYNFFKNIFGIPGNDRPNNYNDESQNYEDERNKAWDEERRENYREHMRERPGESYHNFSLFTDPLEMHRYFEQQMDEVMRSFEGFFGHRSEDDSTFGFGGFGNFEDWFSPRINETPEYSELDPPSELPPRSGSLRNQYLKPGYEQPRNRDTGTLTDSDIDGKLDLGSLDSILGSKPRQELIPRQPNTPTHSSVYGKSFSTRTVQRPDGSVEIHRTTSDLEGNKETVVTRQIGDKKYTVTTRRDKAGKEEKIEDIVNMDDKDLDRFLNVWQQPHQKPEGDPNKYFPFDRFFK